MGVPAGFLLKKKRSAAASLIILFLTLFACIGIGFLFDFLVFESKTLNYILIGMAFSATFANIAGAERTKEIMRLFNPILNISLVIVIVNLGLPLNYRAIAGAGVFTAVYIISLSLIHI